MIQTGDPTGKERVSKFKFKKIEKKEFLNHLQRYGAWWRFNIWKNFPR